MSMSKSKRAKNLLPTVFEVQFYQHEQAQPKRIKIMRHPDTRAAYLAYQMNALIEPHKADRNQCTRPYDANT